MHIVNGLYQYKRRIPAAFVAVLGFEQVRKSTGEKTLRAARLLKERWDAEMNNIFLALKLGSITVEHAKERLVTLFGLPLVLSEQSAGRPTKKSQIEERKRRPTMADLVEAYTNEKSAKWKPKTRYEYLGIHQRIAEYFGRKAVADITRADCVAFRQSLLDSGLTISTTNDKYMSPLSGLLKYAALLDWVLKNHASGLQIPDDRDEREIRIPYDDAEVMQIIKLVSEQFDRYNVDEAHQFWVPLIAAYSGLRMEEVCQLCVSDIGVEMFDREPFDPEKDQMPKDGRHLYANEDASYIGLPVNYFDVNDLGDDKKTKNRPSRRQVPFHPALRRLGLAEYIEALRLGGHERLFPALEPPRSKKYEGNGYSHYLGKWFSPWNRKYITKDKRKTFHSLRHCVADKLQKLEVEPAIISEIMGHAHETMTLRRYAKGYGLRSKFNAISQLSYNAPSAPDYSILGYVDV
jgi:integrase